MKDKKITKKSIFIIILVGSMMTTSLYPTINSMMLKNNSETKPVFNGQEINPILFNTGIHNGQNKINIYHKSENQQSINYSKIVLEKKSIEKAAKQLSMSETELFGYLWASPNIDLHCKPFDEAHDTYINDWYCNIYGVTYFFDSSQPQTVIHLKDFIHDYCTDNPKGIIANIDKTKLYCMYDKFVLIMPKSDI